VINEQPYYVTGVAAPDRERSAEDLELTGITVRNNSIWIDADGGAGIQLGGSGTEHVIVSNAIHYEGASTSWSCLNADLPDGDYVSIDYNICSFPNAPGAEWGHSVGTAPDPLLAWQEARGFGLNSQAEDPAFADPASADLSAAGDGSPMIDNGHPTLSSDLDQAGNYRDATPDIGAHEWDQSANQDTGTPTDTTGDTDDDAGDVPSDTATASSDAVGAGCSCQTTSASGVDPGGIAGLTLLLAWLLGLRWRASKWLA
jgi:hypothetical protein